MEREKTEGDDLDLRLRTMPTNPSPVTRTLLGQRFASSTPESCFFYLGIRIQIRSANCTKEDEVE